MQFTRLHALSFPLLAALACAACGVPDVVSDTSVRAGDQLGADGYPSVGELSMRAREGETLNYYSCTAVMLCDRAVLTAGHCAINANVLTGGNFSGHAHGKDIFSPIAAVTRHPAYDPDVTDAANDLAIMALSWPIKDMQSADFLPLATDENVALEAGVPLTIVGYGSDSGPASDGVKRFGIMRAAGEGATSMWGGFGADHTVSYEAGYSNQLTCDGDSGAPVLAVENGRLVIAGIHAVGSERGVWKFALWKSHCWRNSIGYAASTARHGAWIQQQKQRYCQMDAATLESLKIN